MEGIRHSSWPLQQSLLKLSIKRINEKETQKDKDNGWRERALWLQRMITVSEDKKWKEELAKLKMQNTKCLQRWCHCERRQVTALNSPEKSQELKAPDVGHVGVESIGRKSEKCLQSQYKEHLGPQILSSIPPIQATVPPSFCQDDRGFLFHGKFEWLHTQDAMPRGSRGEMHGNKGLSANLYIGTWFLLLPAS